MARGQYSDSGGQSTLQRIKRDVASRLRNVCAGWSDDDFNQLVARIAAIEVKYTLRRSEDLFNQERSPRRVPDKE